MEHFIELHRDLVAGTISCFDRVLFKGHLPLNWPEAMESLMEQNDVLIRDFKSFVNRNSERVKTTATAMAEQAGRPYLPVPGRSVRKDEIAAAIAGRDSITEGLVCILTAVEACNSFKVVPGAGRPRIVTARRKCLCLYFYFMDPRFGLMHVRITTWFPFMVQVCINGHDWLARRLAAEGIGFTRRDNAFTRIENCSTAQQLADGFVRLDWPAVLAEFAARVNPLLQDLLAGMTYYWVTEQAEYATDVMFVSPSALKPLYENLLRHALLCFSAEDVMKFLGRKLHGAFAGEMVDQMTKRWPGARIKHRMKENWIKMYDKHACVLRVETVINSPYEFRIRRRAMRKGQAVIGWFPMAKGVASLPRYREVCLAANRRYLNALAGVRHPGTARRQLRELGRRVRTAGRSYRGFNPLDPRDMALFCAVMRGEHAVNGFRNSDMRPLICPRPPTAKEKRRHSARISRKFRLLHVHGFIARIPRTRRWRVTQKGHALMATMVEVHTIDHPDTLLEKTA